MRAGEAHEVDGRLLPPAAAAWVGAAVTRWALLAIDPLDARVTAAGRAVVALVVVAVTTLLALGVVAIALRREARGPVPMASRCRRSVVPVVVAVAAGIVAASSAALAVVAASPAPVAAWVDARATADVTGVVTGVPRMVDGPRAWQEPRMELRLASARLAARGDTVAVELPVVLRLAMGAVPPPGAWLEASGRLGPALPGTDAAIALSVSRWATVAAPGWLEAWTQAMRDGLSEALRDVDAESGALVAGLAIGDDDAAPPDLDTAMRASGLAHLTAVSGGNIAILLGVVVGLTRLLRASLRARTVASIVALGVFTLLVGPQPSVLRAVAMGVVATVGVLVGGRRGSLSVLGAGVLVLVVLAPWLATSWGFALSALATAGIVLLSPLLAERLGRAPWTRRWPVAVREATALTAAAQLGTLPVLVAMGGAAGWVALPANLLAAPFVVPVTILGLAAALLGPVLPSVATLLAHTASWPATAIATIAHTAAAAPAAGLPWPSGWPGLLALGALVVVVAGVRAGLRRLRLHLPWRAVALVGAGLTVVLVLLPPGRHGWPPADWLVLMCDVGQGDALLLHAGDGAAVVVDTGPDPDAIDRCLADVGVDVVPVVVLTHFHADHVGGLAGVLRGREVGQVLVTPVRDPVEGADDVDRTLAAAGLRATAVGAGDRRQVGAVSWEAIWPRRRIDAGSVANNASIVLVAEVDGRSVLLTGDIEAEAQAAIADDVRGRRLDIVKVPHHGSANVVPDLTRWARAPIALISVGADNDYGQPAASTVEAWRAAGALVARTDESGDVAVVPTADGVGVVTRN